MAVRSESALRVCTIDAAKCARAYVLRLLSRFGRLFEVAAQEAGIDCVLHKFRAAFQFQL
jgi:hypothetical protein